MGTPLNVSLLSHRSHDPGNTLGVLSVVLKAFGHVAVVASLFRRDPLGHGSHQAGEFPDTEVTQNLHVLVDIPGFRSN